MAMAGSMTTEIMRCVHIGGRMSTSSGKFPTDSNSITLVITLTSARVDMDVCIVDVLIRPTFRL
jgi:hypothetical protein